MEDSLLERVTAAAEERQLSHNSLIAYRRTWLKIIAWAAAEGLVLETFPPERVGELESISKRGLDSDGPTPINYGEPICILCFSDFQRGQRNDKPLTSLASPRFEMLSLKTKDVGSLYETNE